MCRRTKRVVGSTLRHAGGGAGGAQVGYSSPLTETAAQDQMSGGSSSSSIVAIQLSRMKASSLRQRAYSSADAAGGEYCQSVGRVAERPWRVVRVTVRHRESVSGSVGRSRSPLCTVAGACGGPRVGPSWAHRAGARASSSVLEHCTCVFTYSCEVGLKKVISASDLHEECCCICVDLT